MSRDAFGNSAVGDNKDNLAKCVDGEEADAGGTEVDVFVFLAFFGLQRGCTGSGGMMAESVTSIHKSCRENLIEGWDYRDRWGDFLDCR